jgi:transcriptional regulator with XRE-family HTH domain
MAEAGGSGPVLSRRRLSAVLRRIRDDAGLTQESVAAEMDWSLSKLIRIERANVSISTSDLRMLLQHYQVTDATLIRQMVEWARAARAKPWWAPYREMLPTPTFESLLGLEADAAVIEVFHSTVIPGLLQTERYSRSLLANYAAIYLERPVVEARAEVRMRRQQEVFHRRPRLDVIIDEAVLRRATGDAATMRGQLEHLLAIGQRDEASIRIIPFSAGPYVSSGSFNILLFDDAADSSAVYVELFDTDTLLEDAHDVALYSRLFEWMQEKALDPADSARLIKRVADEFN